MLISCFKVTQNRTNLQPGEATHICFQILEHICDIFVLKESVERKMMCSTKSAVSAANLSKGQIHCALN